MAYSRLRSSMKCTRVCPTRTPNIPVRQQEDVDLVYGPTRWQSDQPVHRVNRYTKFTISNSNGLPSAKVYIQNYISKLPQDGLLLQILPQRMPSPVILLSCPPAVAVLVLYRATLGRPTLHVVQGGLGYCLPLQFRCGL